MRDHCTTMFLVLAGVLLLSACQTLPTVPGGGTSIMRSANTRVRSQLVINPVPLERRPAYIPVQGCSYRTNLSYMTGETREVLQELTIRRVRDRLLISVTGENPTTILVGNDGRIYDFNSTQSDGSRSTAETFGSIATRRADELRATHGAGTHVINEITAAFPHYLEESFSVGSVVAVVTDESNKRWASYIYRGTTNYHGTEAIVLDLIRESESDPDRGPLTVGFTIIDLARSIPLIYVIDAGSEMFVERISCR